MRSSRVGLLFCFLIFSVPLWPRQTSQAQPTPGAQGVALLQQAARAITGNTAVTDVTLTGTARRIAGSDDETGTVTLQALATGQSQMKCSYPSGPLSELISISSIGVPVGSWSGANGAVHPMSYHNLLTDSSWFFPALTLTKLLASQ